MQTTFEVSDYYELLALHRALMEAKFNPCPNDEAIAGSRFIGKMAHELVDVLIQVKLEAGNLKKVKQWEKWRRLDGTRREWQIALQRVQEVRENSPDVWQKWTDKQKNDYCLIVLSPFKVEGEVLAQFMAQLEGEESNLSTPTS